MGSVHSKISDRAIIASARVATLLIQNPEAVHIINSQRQNICRARQGKHMPLTEPVQVKTWAILYGALLVERSKHIAEYRKARIVLVLQI
jgi:hypothetical protein